MNNGQATEVRRVTLWGSAVNIFLSAGKIAAGVIYSSQSLIADGIHSLSDLATDIVVLVGVRYWSAPPDSSHPYGHAKIESIVTAIIGLALVLVGGGIAWDAVLSLLHGQGKEQIGLPALVIAVVSIVLKEALYHWTRLCGQKIGSSALEANAWHHRSDAISSIPVVIAIGIRYFYPSLYFADSAGALLVSTFIVHAAWSIMRPTFDELTDANPADTAGIRKICLSVPGTNKVHAIRARKYGKQLQVDLHLLVFPQMTVMRGHAVAKEVQKRLIESNLDIADAIIHIEPDTEEENREGFQEEQSDKENAK